MNSFEFVFIVSGESLRYTARDMEIIRREARISADDSRDELDKIKRICKMYEQLYEDLVKMKNQTLLDKVRT